MSRLQENHKGLSLKDLESDSTLLYDLKTLSCFHTNAVEQGGT